MSAACELEIETALNDGRTAWARGRVEGPAGAPLVLVLGGISAGRFVADGDGAHGWWRDQAGPGKALDTTSFRILGMDFLGEAVAPFPTTQDQARAALALADAAGAEHFTAVGASYGGMIVLALAALAPQRVSAAAVISAADATAPLAAAWRSIQRATVEFALAHGDGEAGLDLARRLAMTTYRTPREFDARFRDPAPGSRDADGPAAWLAARGRAWRETMTPERFLALSRSMDAHDVDVAAIAAPVDYLAVAEDALVPSADIAAAAGRTPQGRFTLLRSHYGHDAFLKETAAIAALLNNLVSTREAA